MGDDRRITDEQLDLVPIPVVDGAQFGPIGRQLQRRDEIL